MPERNPCLAGCCLFPLMTPFSPPPPSPRQAYDLDFPPGLTVMGVDYDDLTNGEQNAPSIFSSAGLSAGAFLKSPYDSHPPGSNASVPDIQVCAKRVR